MRIFVILSIGLLYSFSFGAFDKSAVPPLDLVRSDGMEVAQFNCDTLGSLDGSCEINFLLKTVQETNLSNYIDIKELVKNKELGSFISSSCLPSSYNYDLSNNLALKELVGRRTKIDSEICDCRKVPKKDQEACVISVGKANFKKERICIIKSHTEYYTFKKVGSEWLGSSAIRDICGFNYKVRLYKRKDNTGYDEDILERRYVSSDPERLNYLPQITRDICTARKRKTEYFSFGEATYNNDCERTVLSP